ncbi:MAG: 5-(carboxyamino)imidazole ribonucleotide mutase, partial [Oscillospiraceae bacterium]|nr:5-(carboxyamino)imidazole ribonucleotide mutase [Oscillospiraceae bacterium]
MKKVGILMGSKNDLEVIKPALATLKKFGVPFEVHVLSAHRTPEASAKFAQDARKNGFGTIIGAAGKAAHLAGVLAAHTTLPVIALPIGSPALGGLDALLAMVQMPPGVPVATVGIDGAENAALLAVQMLAVSDESLAEKLSGFKKDMNDKILAADKALQDEIENI